VYSLLYLHVSAKIMGQHITIYTYPVNVSEPRAASLASAEHMNCIEIQAGKLGAVRRWRQAAVPLKDAWRYINFRKVREHPITLQFTPPPPPRFIDPMTVHSLLMYQRGIQNWSDVKVSVVNLLIVRGLKQKNMRKIRFLLRQEKRGVPSTSQSRYGFFHISFYTLFLSVYCYHHSVQLRGRGTRLRHYATNQKVAGPIPDGVTGIFHWHNPFGRPMALVSNQLLIEMSTRKIWE